jgi:nucleoside-diphosphate-sugar epimerase
MLPLPATVDDLESRLSEPTAGVLETLSRHRGDVVLLGVAGKMGPTLARMIARADEANGVRRRIIGVARFSDADVPRRLEQWGIETITADLLDNAVVRELPDAPLVVYLAGRKFGSTGQESLTWAMNAAVPIKVAERYRDSRIVAFSTGNVYGNTPIARGGSRVGDPLNPIGEYSMSCLARERLFEHASLAHGTPVCLVRLNYACELRYGVLVDLAVKVRDGVPIDLAMGAFNVIWQADANAASLMAFDLCASPAKIVNLTGPETLGVRRVCEEFGRLWDRPVRFIGAEANDALLNDANELLDLTGYPRVSPTRMMEWIVDWLRKGQPTLNKPTHFENRDGTF